MISVLKGFLDITALLITCLLVDLIVIILSSTLPSPVKLLDFNADVFTLLVKSRNGAW